MTKHYLFPRIMPNHSPARRGSIQDDNHVDNDDDGVTVTANDDDYSLLESSDVAEATKESGSQTPPPTTARLASHSPIPFRPLPRSLATHITKINIYIHTSNNPALSKVTTMEHPCPQNFYNQRQRLEDIMDKARNCLLNQEPYYTMINAGYNLYLREPQVSYKVLAIDDNFLIDFVVDVNNMAYTKPQPPLPEPFYETKGESLWSQTDVSFRFKVHHMEVLVHPQTREMATMTSDAVFVSPLIDTIRTSAEAWAASLNQTEDVQTPASTMEKPKPRLNSLPKLDDDAPPRHHLASTSSGSSDGHLIRDRLGPPVGRSFATRLPLRDPPRDRKRSGSNDRHKNKKTRR
jgi:hypothetical protein